MFKNKTKNEDTALNETIDDVINQMKSLTADTIEYSNMVDQLEKLYRIRTASQPDKVSKDAALAVTGNLAGIVAILGYERAHVIASKALGFVIKSRI